MTRNTDTTSPSHPGPDQFGDCPRPIGNMDLLIADHTLAENAVLVSNSTREFERVTGLKLENWA